MELTPETFFDMAQTEHAALFEGAEHAWDALKRIGDYLRDRLRPAMHGTCIGSPYIGEAVFVGPGTVIEQGAFIKGPAWIGAGCQIRAGCYIRENVIIGDRSVAGNSCEFKNCLLFNNGEVPHFNYVGDSILGHKAHIGAGVILSNVKLTRDTVQLHNGGKLVDTGLRKFGAIIGDRTEVGCNSVLNPGSVLGKNCLLYPMTQWRGLLPSDSIVKTTQNQQILEKRSGR